MGILLCNEVGLNSEFCTLIAQQIREQITSLKRAQTINSNQDDYYSHYSRVKKVRGTMSEVSKLEQRSRKEAVNTENYFRKINTINFDGSDNLTFWEPKITVMTEEEIAKHEHNEERKYRHERRERTKRYHQ